MKIILQAIVAHIHPLPAVSQDLVLAPRADSEAPLRRRTAEGPRVVLRSAAGRHQPRHRPDPFDTAGARPSRLLDGVAYAASTLPRRPTDGRAPAAANAAFLAQQFAQAGDADDDRGAAGLAAEAAAAYQATAERGITLLGPELNVSYRL